MLFYKRNQVHQDTITDICGLRYRLMERMSYNNKHTMTLKVNTAEAGTGDRTAELVEKEV